MFNIFTELPVFRSGHVIDGEVITLSIFLIVIWLIERTLSYNARNKKRNKA